jgi:tRNA pseudouridine55 synthase
MLGGMFGFFNVNKPPGPTSHDIVAGIRRMLPRKTKLGHAGTLDPFASGVLVLCVGPATRLAEFVQRQVKRYTATIALGATSTTDDIEGEISTAAGLTQPHQQRVLEVLAGFVGDIRQAPPAHSAVHVDGQRAYKLAREGKAVEPPARTVTVRELTLLKYDWPRLEIDVTCGSGTYIRSLARDIGGELGCGGYCRSLTRVAVGGFDLQSAVRPEELDPSRDLLAPQTGLDIPLLEIQSHDAADIRMGKSIILSDAPAEQTVGLVGPDGQLLAIAAATEDGKTIKPKKVFA